jgi:hypothetical protein
MEPDRRANKQTIRLYRSEVSPAAYGGCLSDESQTLLWRKSDSNPRFPLQVLSVSEPPHVLSVTLRRFPAAKRITLSRPGDG